MQKRVLESALQGVEVANVLTTGYAHAEKRGLPTDNYRQDLLAQIGNIASYMIAQEGIAERMEVPHPDAALLEGSTYQALTEYRKSKSIDDIAAQARLTYDAMLDAQLESTPHPEPIPEHQRERLEHTNERLRKLHALDSRDLIRLHQEGDTDASAILLSHHRGMIWSLAYGFVKRTPDTPGISPDDLFQVGVGAFLEEIKQFDPDQSGSFVNAYAPTVREAMRKFIANALTPIRITRETRRQIKRLKHAQDQPSMSYDTPSDTTLSDRLDLPMGGKGSFEEVGVNTIKSLRRYAMMEHMRPLEDAEMRENPNRYERAGGESLSSDPLPELETEAVKRVLIEEELPTLLSRLTDRERQVIQLRYWEGMDSVSIGRRLGITRSTAADLHTVALAKLRHPEQSGRFRID